MAKPKAKPEAVTGSGLQCCEACGGPIYTQASIITQSRDVYHHFAALRGASEERFVVLALNARNRIMSETVVAVGSVNTVHVSPAQVMRPAILAGATSIICIHNHPSGDPDPSPEDRLLTERLTSGAALLGLRFLDHVIVGDGFYSFADCGVL